MKTSCRLFLSDRRMLRLLQKEIQVSDSGFTVIHKKQNSLPVPLCPGFKWLFLCRCIISVVQVSNFLSSRSAFMIYNLIKAELYMMFVLQIRFSCEPFMSLSIRVTIVILVIFDNEGHRNWLQRNCGLFSLYLNCKIVFTLWGRQLLRLVFFIPLAERSDGLTSRFPWMLRLVWPLAWVWFTNLFLSCASAGGTMSVEVDLLVQEAKESIEAAQNYRSELQQRLHGLNQARKQVAASVPPGATQPSSLHLRSLLYFCRPPPQTSKQCCYFLFLQANGKMEEVKQQW